MKSFLNIITIDKGTNKTPNSIHDSTVLCKKGAGILPLITRKINKEISQMLNSFLEGFITLYPNTHQINPMQKYIINSI